jgi:hypothetical protein
MLSSDTRTFRSLSADDVKTDNSVHNLTWTNSIEDTLKNIGDSCQGYKWMYLEASQKTERENAIFAYLVIFLPAISTFFQLLDQSLSYLAFSVVAMATTILSGTISALIKRLKLERKSGSYKTVASNYASLEMNITRQLSLDRNSREDVKGYMNYVFLRYDELFSSAPIVPDSVFELWKNHAENKGLEMPKKLSQNIQSDNEDVVKELCSKDEIKVNRDECKINIVEPKNPITEQESIPKPMEKLPTLTHRTSFYNFQPDLKKFDDAKMRYEIKRLYGLD